MYDLNSLYSMNGGTLSSGTLSWYIVGGILALIGAIVVGIVFIRSENRGRYTGWMKRVSTHVNFERYIIPLILKFLYTFTVLLAVFNGIITIFTSSIWSGLLMIVVAPILIRMAYELIMMLFSIHNGIMETNRLLRGGAQPLKGSAPQQYGRQMRHAEPAQEEAPSEQPRQYPGGYDPMHRS
jgi:hypothetical protein